MENKDSESSKFSSNLMNETKKINDQNNDFKNGLNKKSEHP